MITEMVDADLARKLEFAEIHAWNDQWDAFPDLARKYRMRKQWVEGALILSCLDIPFVEFNRALGVGLAASATEEGLDRILEAFASEGVDQYLIHRIPQTQPAELDGWLRTRNLSPSGGWDRIFRSDEPLPADVSIPSQFQVERVTQKTSTEWADFIVTMYDLEPTRQMLLALAARPGWFHYMLREGHDIVAVRTMYLHPDGVAWWGIEAPVPGFMTDRFDLDYYLNQEIIQDGLAQGAKTFVADVEAADPDMGHEGYRYFSKLGFRKAYRRENYAPHPK